MNGVNGRNPYGGTLCVALPIIGGVEGIGKNGDCWFGCKLDGLLLLLILLLRILKIIILLANLFIISSPLPPDSLNFPRPWLRVHRTL